MEAPCYVAAAEVAAELAEIQEREETEKQMAKEELSPRTPSPEMVRFELSSLYSIIWTAVRHPHFIKIYLFLIWSVQLIKAP